MGRTEGWWKVHSSHLVIALGLTCRLVLVRAGISDTLQRRPELSTPLTSWRSLREGLFIYSKGSDPYNGGIFYHSPLHLFLFTYLVPTNNDTISALFFIAWDLLVALVLNNIWKTRSSASGIDGRSRQATVLASYLLNPYTIASCSAKTTGAIDHGVFLLSLHLAQTNHILGAFALLAMAASSNIYLCIMVLPLSILVYQQSYRQAFYGVTSFALTFAGLAGMFTAVLGKRWIAQTWGTTLTVPDLTPNVGMWWYFFTEMFDHFRAFFLGVFQYTFAYLAQVHAIIYTIPISLRLSHDPLMAIMVLFGVISSWKSYPSLGDIATWGALLSCFPEVVANLRHPLFTLAVYLYTSILLPLLHSLWLLQGSGNANFFYAATMVYGLNNSLAVVDVLGAGFRSKLKREIEQYHDSTLDQSQSEKGNGEKADMWDDEYSIVQLTSQASL